MSLINEALKRTRDATYQTGAAPSDAGDYRATQVATSSSFGSRTGRIAMLVIALLVVGMVGLVGRRIASPFKTLESGLESAASAPVPAQQVSAIQQPQRPAAPAISQAEPKPAVNVKAVEDQPVAKAPQPPAPVAPEPPKFVLQGIITGEANAREAMINSYSVHEGEEIGAAKVLSIDARSVRLLVDGHELTLRMP